ncbi:MULTISPECIES: YcnI family protein [unclassified Micromonospora]|uniref:YcnI family protein n=1 Tax=unclassified Micromonospora TaxID=2617518 RepID=UPI001FFDAED5|nr:MULTISPECIES: YcnI family protein [unclassified Micromonospora]
MRMTRQGRWAAALLAAALTGAVSWPGAASAAEVTVTTSPAEVRQGDAIQLSVVVPADRPGSRTTKIELTMPPDAPIGEVYPLSVPDWAPTITTRTLDQPVPGMHAAELNQVTHAVTWLRVPGTGSGAAQLPLGMGPMPATDRLTFTVVQTYADGTVVRWADPAGGKHPAPTVELLPPLPGTMTHNGDPGTNGGAHGGHGAAGGAQGGVPGGAQNGAPNGAAPAAGAADDGPSADLLLGGGLLAGLAGGAAIGWLLSRRRRDTMTLPHDDSPSSDSPSPDDSLTPDAPAATERPDTDPRSDSPEPAVTPNPADDPSASDPPRSGPAPDLPRSRPAPDSPADSPAPDSTRGGPAPHSSGGDPAPASPRGELAPDSPDSDSSARPLGEPVPAGGARRDA